MMKFLRENKYAAAVLFFLRVYVGWLWLDAGWHKLVGGFTANGYLTNAVANPVMKGEEVIYPTYTAFIEYFALPNIKLIDFLIPLGEFLIGLGLIVGALTTAAAFFGLVLNFMFLFAGTVSTNPWMLLIGGIVLIAGTNAGRFGVDYYLMPLLRKLFNRNKVKNTEDGEGTAIRPEPHTA